MYFLNLCKINFSKTKSIDWFNKWQLIQIYSVFELTHFISINFLSFLQIINPNNVLDSGRCMMFWVENCLKIQTINELTFFVNFCITSMHGRKNGKVLHWTQKMNWFEIENCKLIELQLELLCVVFAKNHESINEWSLSCIIQHPEEENHNTTIDGIIQLFMHFSAEREWNHNFYSKVTIKSRLHIFPDASQLWNECKA